MSSLEATKNELLKHSEALKSEVDVTNGKLEAVEGEEDSLLGIDLNLILIFWPPVLE